MTATRPLPPPSRLHELMRHGRSYLIARYFMLAPWLSPVGKTAIADNWSSERLSTAIRDLEREEAPGDVAHDG